MNWREGRGTIVHKTGSKYQHNWLYCTYLQSINSIKHQKRRHLGYGVFIVIWSMARTYRAGQGETNLCVNWGRPTSDPVARPLSPPSPCESPAVPFRPSCGFVASSKTCSDDGTLYTLQRKSHLCISLMGIARPQSQFPHSCVCERIIYSQDRSAFHICIFPAAE